MTQNGSADPQTTKAFDIAEQNTCERQDSLPWIRMLGIKEERCRRRVNRVGYRVDHL